MADGLVHVFSPSLPGCQVLTHVYSFDCCLAVPGAGDGNGPRMQLHVVASSCVKGQVLALSLALPVKSSAKSPATEVSKTDCQLCHCHLNDGHP